MKIRSCCLGASLGCVVLAANLVFAQAVPPTGQSPAVAEAPAPAAAPLGVIEVAYRDGKLSLKAENADLARVLRRIGGWAGVGVQIGEGVAGKVTSEFVGLTLEEGINRVLEAADARDYAAVFEKISPTGSPILRNIAVMRKGAGGAAASPQTFAWPPKKKATLKSSGKEIEYFKGLFVIIPGLSWSASMRDMPKMPFGDNVRYIESKYPLRKVNGPGGRDFLYELDHRPKYYLFEAVREVDEVELLRRLNTDDHVYFASLYGMGKESAILPTDEKGRYHMLGEEEAEQLRKAMAGAGWRPGGKISAEVDKIAMEFMPWLKEHCYEGPGIEAALRQPKICFPFVEGRLSVNIGASRLKEIKRETDWLDDRLLEAANDFSGVIVNRSIGVDSGNTYGILFPAVRGEEIYSVMKAVSSRDFPAGVYPWGVGRLQSNDPYVQHQWALQRINAAQAWSTWDRRNPSRTIDVAVVDSGIGLQVDPAGQALPLPHPDFYNSPGNHTVDLASARDFSVTGNESNALADIRDTHGHGTMVAGIVAAAGDNGRGLDGVACNENARSLVQVVPVRYTSGFERFPSPDILVKALRYVKEKKLPVVNMSYEIREAWYIAEYVRDIYSSGGVVVAAGPNRPDASLCEVTDLDTYTILWKGESSEVFSNDNLPNVKSLFDKILMVTSTDEDDAIDGACDTSVLLDVAAPGKNVLSLRPFNLMVPDEQLPSHWGPCPECIDASGQPDLGYMKGWGTSFATPHVSATAALILAMGGTAERDKWVSQEKAYSAIPRLAHALPNHAYGRLDMAATMTSIIEDTTPPAAPTGLWLSQERVRDTILGKESVATKLHWNAVWEGSIRYKIYRSAQADFRIGSENFLCYANEPQLTQVDAFIATGDPFYYRVTAVDPAGNESEPSAAASLGNDFVFMVSRSSRWVWPRAGSTDNYFDSVKKLIGTLAEKVPNGSRVGVLVFREKVFSEHPSLQTVDGTAEGGQRRTGSGDFALDALSIPLGTNADGTPERWTKDYWYLDLAEVLEGGNGDAPWRATPLQAQGTSNGLSLLPAVEGRNRVGILISDWYDNSLVSALDPSAQRAVYEAWSDSMWKAADQDIGYNLKNVILHGQERFSYGSTGEYLSSLGVKADTLNWMMAAIGESGGKSDAKILRWDPTGVYDTTILEELTHCRDNLLNVVAKVQPGERRRVPLHLDGSVQDVGILLFGVGLTHRLIRPDGTPVELEVVDGERRSRDPLVYFRRFEGMGVDRFAMSRPLAGEWTLEIDGGALTRAVESSVLAFGTTGVRLDQQVPRVVRPGVVFEIEGVVSDTGVLAEAPEMTFRLMRTGDVFSLGSKIRDYESDGTAQPGGTIRFSRKISIEDVEGSLPYRFLLEGRDREEHPVSREVTGSLFVHGDAPVVAAGLPVGEIVEESPSITVLVADDVKVAGYSVRVDGRALDVKAEDIAPSSVAGQFTAPAPDWQPRQIKRLTGQVTWALSPGEHTVEVTASDTIAQEAAPEIWSFRVGGGLLATDALGDDHGPGYYTYPTNSTLMPRGALDLEGFRVYRDGSLVSLNIDLQNYYYYLSSAPTLSTLPMVVDVYLDTDGVSGSGRTDLLPGRNALLRAQDAWEYCLTISREGAKLISASGSETPVTATFNAGTAMLSVVLENAQLGVSDQRALDGWGYLVTALGYDGLNTGHVKEVSTLGGAHVFGGGAEGSGDPNIIDLLAAGSAQEMMLGSYSVPQGRLAEVTAYRFAYPAPVEDVQAPVLSALVPAVVTAANPPQIGFTASDDWALDLTQMQLWVDTVQVSSAALVVTGNDRLATLRYSSGAALAEGRHEVRAEARDQAGNTVAASWEFVLGAAAHIATVGGAPRSEAMALRGSASVVGTAAGGTSWRLEHSADGVAWTQIGSGTTEVVAGALGNWATSAGIDGGYELRLTVAGDGWEQTDTLAVQVDNTLPEAGLASVGAATSGGLLKGTAVVLGWATDENLSSWAVSYGAGESPASWMALGAGSSGAGSVELPASLGSLNTAGIADARWTLRLVARDLAGNERDSRFAIQSDNTAPEAAIESPVAAASVPVGSRVSISGTAYDHHLQDWVLEYGSGADPPQWQQIAASTSLANHSLLTVWDTANLVPGEYSLQLTVTDRVGSSSVVRRTLTLTSAPLARIAGIGPLTLPSPAGGEGNFVTGSVEVRGSAGFATGGAYVVEASADGTSWAPIGSGTTAVTDGVLATWETGAGADGTYTVRLTVLEAGSTSASDQATVTVDNTAPVVAIGSPVEGAGIACEGYVPIGTDPGATAARCRVEITGTASDAHLASYTLEWGAGAAPESWTGLATFSPRSVTAGLLGLWETTGLEVGIYTLRLKATDRVGAATEALRTVQVTTDSIAPVVALEAPLDGTVTSATTVEVSGSVTDTALASWELTAQPFVNGAWGGAQTLAGGTANVSSSLHVWDVSALDGRYRLALTGEDATGNAASATVEVIFVHGAGYAQLESVGPLPLFTGSPSPSPLPSRAGYVEGVVEVRGSALAPALIGYVLEASADGTSWSQVATGTTAVAHDVLGTWDTTALGDGAGHLRLRVLDASATKVSDSALVAVDNLPPTVAITQPSSGGMIGGYQYILGTAADAHFDSYTLEVASAASPDLWWPIGGRSLAVTAGNLGTWVVDGDVGPFKQLFAVGGSNSFLRHVVDIDAAADGRVFALDTYNQRVRVFDHQGTYRYSIGGDGELNNAVGLFIKDDELFVANNGAYGGTNKVLIYSLDGAFKAMVPLSVAAADAPYDVAVDDSGLIYVSCTNAAAIKVYTRSGELVRTLAPRIDNQQPRFGSIDIDGAGDIYVSAPELAKLVKLTPMGEYLQSYGQQNLGTGGYLSSFIGGAQVDRSGNVYLADRQSGIIYQFDAAGTWIGAVGPFNNPDCFKVDDEGLLYVGMPFEAGFVALAPSTPVEAAALPEGPYTLRLRATDQAGHSAETLVAVAVERTAPEAGITAPISGAAVSGVVAVSGSASDEHFARYELWRATPRQVRDPVTLSWSEVLENQTMIGAAQITAVANGTLGTWDTTGLAPGSYALLLRVYDAAGNQSEARVDVSVGTAAEALTVALTAPVAHVALAAGVTVEVRGSIAVDGGVLDHYAVGYGQGTAPQSWVEIGHGYTTPSAGALLGAWDTTGLVQGEYTLLVRAASLTGKQAEARVALQVSAGPVVAVMSPAQGAAVAGVVEILGTIWDEDLAGYTLERGAGASPSSWEQIAASSLPVASGVLFRWDTAGLDGEYCFRLRATDVAGNQSTLVRQVSADNTPPVASLRAEMNNFSYGMYTSTDVWRGEQFSLKGSATDDQLKSYRIDVGEGATPTSWTTLVAGTTAVADGTFVPGYSTALAASVATAALVTYRLTVEDGAGNISRADLTLRINDQVEFAQGVVSSPMSVAVSPQGRLYVLDEASYQITILDAATGEFIDRCGGFGSANGRFTSPTDLATDAQGNVYVLEWSGRLQKLDASGVFIASLPIRGSGLTVGDDGTLYVTGKPAGEQHHLRIYTPAGALIRGFGADGTGAGLFDSFSAYSQQVVRDRFGYLYISNGDRGAEVFDPMGRFVAEVQYRPGTSGHRYARGIGVDGDGNPMLGLGYQRGIWKTRLDGRALWYRNLYPGVPGDIEISPWGTFVCDTSANKIWRLTAPAITTEPTQPQVRIDSPADGSMTNKDYLVVIGSGSAPGFAEYRLAWAAEANPGALTEIVASAEPIRDGTLGFWRVAELPNGTYRLRLTLRDQAGSEWTDEIAVTLGKTVPVVAIGSPGQGMTNDATPRLAYTVSAGTVVVKLDGQPIATLSGDTLDALADGEHRVRVEATDAAGNVGAAEVVFTVDTVAPAVAISSPAAGVLAVSSPVLTYSVSDGVVVVELDGQPIARRSGEALDSLADGAHRVHIEAMDAAGNVGAAEVVFTVDTTPPVVPGEKTLTLIVDGGAGTPIVGANAYLFSAAGVYLGAAAATDGLGRAAFTVMAGSYKIRCDYLGYQFWSTEIDVSASASLALSIPHRSVTVSVAGSYDGTQQARPNVPVYLFTEGART